MNYNEQLQQLQENVLRKKSLEAKLNELQFQKVNLASRIEELKKIMYDEQTDVERLERTSLASVFYTFIGKKEDMLDKEKVEAYEAKVKYDSAILELNLVKEDISGIQTQIREISGCERRYETLLDEKVTAIKTSGSTDGERLLWLEKQIASQKSQKKEISEAIATGSRALDSANNVLSSLDSAEGWGKWDLVGGGLVSGLAKHSHLDEAQSKVCQLQSDLRRFKTELADVTIHTDIQVSVDGFLRFADYFFDGLFADWAVLKKINESKSRVKSTKSQIEKVLSRLRTMETVSEQEITKLEKEKDAVVINTTL